ncbi:hypothetical protein ACFQU4_35560 [Microlunatus sp. GCM10028923]
MGAAGVVVWTTLNQGGGPGTPAIPLAKQAGSPDKTPEDGSGATGKQSVGEAITTCRREVALAESVLAAAGDGVGHWREHVQAQTDLSLGRTEEDEAEKIWKRTRQAGASDVAKYQTAKSGRKADGNACRPVADAEDDQVEQLKMCQARLSKVTSALTNADLAMKDWQRQLEELKDADEDNLHDYEDSWLDTWRKAPKNLDRYSSAMDTLAKTKSCPR